MKFTDKDICGFDAFDNGVVLKINQQSVLDSEDGEGKVAVYLHLNEVSDLMDAVYRDSPDEPAPDLPDAFSEFVTNSGDLNQVLVVLHAKSVRECPTAKRNRAFVFISLDVLYRIKAKLGEGIERRRQTETFDKAFSAMTGRNLVVEQDNSRVVMKKLDA